MRSLRSKALPIPAHEGRLRKRREERALGADAHDRPLGLRERRDLVPVDQDTRLDTLRAVPDDDVGAREG